MGDIEKPAGEMGQEKGALGNSSPLRRRKPDPLDAQSERSRGIDPKLLELIVCPVTKATLEYDAVKQELISREAKLAYPIRDGIPIMLSDEARKLD